MFLDMKEWIFFLKEYVNIKVDLIVVLRVKIGENIDF